MYNDIKRVYSNETTAKNQQKESLMNDSFELIMAGVSQPQGNVKVCEYQQLKTQCAKKTKI